MHIVHIFLPNGIYDKTYQTKAQNCTITNIITKIEFSKTNIATKVIIIEETNIKLAISLTGFTIFLNCLSGPIKNIVL